MRCALRLQRGPGEQGSSFSAKQAVEEEGPARHDRDQLSGPRSRERRDPLSKRGGEVLVETRCWLPFHAISRTLGTFQAKEPRQEGAVGDLALWDWRR